MDPNWRSNGFNFDSALKIYVAYVYMMQASIQNKMQINGGFLFNQLGKHFHRAHFCSDHSFVRSLLNYAMH